MDTKKQKKVHLIGIGGSGMSSLAGLFREVGWDIQGSDRSEIYPPASNILRDFGARYTEGFDEKNISEDIDLAIIGNIVSEGNVEFEKIKSLQIPYCSMAEAIHQYFTKGKQSIVVTGTHGKTTTTTMLAYVLKTLGSAPGYFIGGKPLDLKEGYEVGQGDYFVIEGDEYHSACFEREPKFLHYGAQHVVMNNLEFDHADIYPNIESIEAEFFKLAKQIPENGSLYFNGDDERLAKVAKHCTAKTHSFGQGKNCLWRMCNYQSQQLGQCSFDVERDGKAIAKVELGMQGIYNAQNALVCFAMLFDLGFQPKKILDGLRGFTGVKKRQELIGSAMERHVYQDFAHHPTAVKETLEAFAKAKGRGRLLAIFEPRSGSARRNVFQKQWPESFLASDLNLIAPVFNGAKSVSNLLDLQILQADIEKLGKHVFVAESYDDIESFILKNTQPDDILVFMSSGDFGDLPNKVLKKLNEMSLATSRK